MSLLQIDDLAVQFGGIRAVDGVSFAVQAGEIVSLIGSNGAGKTTIFNLVSRFYAPSAGVIRFDGLDITALPAYRMASLGIARTFQNIELFDQASVRDNLLLGCAVRRRTNVFEEMLFLPRVARQEAAFRNKVEGIIALLKLEPYQDAIISSLPYGIRKIVELGRALAVEPKLLLLDEPSSGLNDTETAVMGNWILDIRARLGVTVLIVEHDMNLVSAVSDRVIALEAGRILTQGSPDEVRSNPSVINMYLGGQQD